MADEQESQRPTSADDRAGWHAYWTTHEMPWRIDPEIGEERQRYLAERRNIPPDIEQGIYPFKDVEPKLTRADVEWLLATHESGGMVGPVDWHDPKQRHRQGLDLRGADLRGQELRSLPLACLFGGLVGNEWVKATPEQRDFAGVCLQRAKLHDARLEGAILRRAFLEEAVLFKAHLEHADMRRARLEGTDVGYTLLQGASLPGAYLDGMTRVDHAELSDRHGYGPLLADITWGGINLAVVAWESVKKLGDEREATRRRNSAGGRKSRQEQLDDMHSAVRAYRQLAVALRSQGMNEEADRYAYRALVCQQRVIGRTRRWRYPMWLLMRLIAGYGYRPLRSILTYMAVIVAFAGVYLLLGRSVTPPLSPADAVIFSVTSFHGRGFSPGEVVTLHNPLTIGAAAEAVIGLLIEITVIATLTRRFFAR